MRFNDRVLREMRKRHESEMGLRAMVVRPQLPRGLAVRFNKSDSGEGGEGGGGEGENKGKQPSVEELQAELAKERTEKEKTAAALKEANKEAAERRKKLEAYEGDEKKRKDAELSETQKLQAELDGLRQKHTDSETALRKVRLEGAVKDEARSLKFKDAGDALQMLDMSLVQMGEDGSVTGVKEALAALAKAKPYLLEAADGDKKKDAGDGKGTPLKSKQQQKQLGNGAGEQPTRPRVTL